MNYNKMTIGFVIQTFNDEGECLSQEFMPFGGDEYFPFDMVQPEQFPPLGSICPIYGGIVSLEP